MDEEAKLLEKLRKIEALYSGATTAGEAEAAAEARRRVEARLREVEAADPPVEYKFSLGNTWSRRLFMALLRRHGYEPYRYARQRYTTVMARVPRRFVDETLWPEFQALDEVLTRYLDQVATRVIGEVLAADASEASVVASGALPDQGDD